jgi:hypothetical protein
MGGATMIQKSDMFEPLLAVYPEFRTQHDAFMTEWADDPEGPPNYLLLADLARECSLLLSTHRRNEVTKIFGVVENWLLNGDHYVQEAATIGFLENIQSINFHEGTAPDDFLPFCGPEAQFWWGKVARFWSHGELLVDTRRAESIAVPWLHRISKWLFSRQA